MEPDVISGIYAKCSAFPILVSANVHERQLVDGRMVPISTVTAEWSQTDLVRGSRLRYSQQWTVKEDANDSHHIIVVSTPGPCIPAHGELLSQYSPSGELRAVIRETGGHQLLEIWGCQGLSKCLDLTAVNKHGGVYEDAQFGCLEWSECQSRLLYIAERSRSAESQDGPSTNGKDKSVYCEDWGEGLTGKSTPVVCVLDVERGTLNVLQGMPSHVSPGQALWAPGGQAVVFVGWWHEPFRLGLKFCSNRRSAVFKLDLDGHCECLSRDNMSVSCPRLSPDRASLVFLQGQVFGPHSQCLSLQLYRLESRKTTTVLDVVNRPSQTGEFAGIYEALPSHCWSTDSKRVVFSSAHRNWKNLFEVDVTTRIVTCLSNSSYQKNEVWGSWKLLTIEKDLMVVCCSSPGSPPCLRVGFLPYRRESVDWMTLPDSDRTRYQTTESFDLQWKVMDVTPSPNENNALYSGLDFGAVLVKPHPLPGARSPLVVFIHGGPHSQFPAEWNVTTAGLAKLGYAVLMVNYRGSTGFGQDSILSLIGQIGNQDVKDVQRAVLTALKSDATLDPKRLAVIGGSHGGFLSCHLIGQYPDFYKACAARNPVINAATLLGTSDIVDWRYSCVGLQYSYDQLPTAEALASMLAKSPITHAAQIRAPVLLMLGGRDRRVSPHQGLELHRALKSRGTPVRLLWYPEDGHSLARVNTQADCFLNTVLWLQQHL